MNEDEDLNSHDEYGFTPLYWAIIDDVTNNENDNADETKRLLDAGADPNEKDDKNQRTPLHWAARFGHRNSVELLLSKEVNIDEVDPWGMTPLHLAAREGHKDCVELLLKANADPNAVDSQNRTPLHWAAENGSAECVELLLKAKADPNKGDNGNRTPLYVATQTNRNNSHKACIKLLKTVTSLYKQAYGNVIRLGSHIEKTFPSLGRIRNSRNLFTSQTDTSKKDASKTESKGGNKKKTEKQFKNNKRTTKRSNKRRLSKSRKNR